MIRRVGTVLGSVLGFLVVFSAWQVVVHAAQHRTTGAISNGLALWHVERWLHLPNEAVIVTWTRSSPRLWSLAGWYYVIAHPVAIITALAVLAWLGHGRYRTAFATFGLTALACFALQLWPTAPPRWLPVGAGPAPGQALAEYHSLGSLANQVASFPSVHVAWASCVALSLHQLRRLRWYGWTHLAVTVLVVVATSNHTWLDSAAGIAIAYAAHQVARYVFRNGVAGDAVSGLVTRRIRPRFLAWRGRGPRLAGGDRFLAPAGGLGAVGRLRDQRLQSLVGGGDVGGQAVMCCPATSRAEVGAPTRPTPVVLGERSAAVLALPVVRHGSLPVSCDECHGPLAHLGGQLQRTVEGGLQVPATALRAADAGDQDVVLGRLGARPASGRVEDRRQVDRLVTDRGHGVSFAAPLDAAGVAPAGNRRGARPKRLAVKGATAGSGTPSLDGETGRATRLPREQRPEGASS